MDKLLDKINVYKEDTNIMIKTIFWNPFNQIADDFRLCQQTIRDFGR